MAQSGYAARAAAYISPQDARSDAGWESTRIDACVAQSISLENTASVPVTSTKLMNSESFSPNQEWSTNQKRLPINQKLRDTCTTSVRGSPGKCPVRSMNPEAAYSSSNRLRTFTWNFQGSNMVIQDRSATVYGLTR